MKRDLRKAVEEKKWTEKANNRDQWKQITKVAVIRSDQWTSLTPTTQGKPEEEHDVSYRLMVRFKSGSTRKSFELESNSVESSRCD